ncbi:MAG: beta-lactam-binding protein with PASTA domain [Candidatus Marivariicella framensis]|jgi:beta-lactam-binding protein with PASTA domain|tara:strand:+ start:6842 stop:7393 length:552 start_codon:yes stop_codon:yes gene_type:complete
MSFLKFLISGTFVKLIIKSIVFLTFFIILTLKALELITYHEKHELVPDISGIELNDAIKILNENYLRYEVIDSAKFNPKLPPYAVIEVFPVPLSEVKKDRKIYLTLNPSGYRKISIPNIIQITRRNAESMLRAVGFDIGKIMYRNNIGKDMVLEIRYQGKVIAPGSVLPKTTKIDLILGNGIR